MAMVMVNPAGETKEGHFWLVREWRGRHQEYWQKLPASHKGRSVESVVKAHRGAPDKVRRMNQRQEVEELSAEEREVVEKIVRGETWSEAVKQSYPKLTNAETYRLTAKLRQQLLPYVTMFQAIGLDDSETFDVMQERMLRSLLTNKRTKPNERLQVLREMRKLREGRRGTDWQSLTQQIEAKTKEMQRLLAVREEGAAHGLGAGVDGGIERLAVEGLTTEAAVRGDATSVAPVPGT